MRHGFIIGLFFLGGLAAAISCKGRTEVLAAQPGSQPNAQGGPGVAPRVRYLDAHANGEAAWALAVSPDGKTLASGGDDGKVLLWSLPGLRRLKAINVGDLERCIAFSKDEKYVYTPGGRGFKVAEISVEDGSYRLLDVDVSGSIALVSPVAGDRKLVVVALPNKCVCYSLPEGHTGQPELIRSRALFGEFIRHAVLSPDGRFLAISCQHTRNRAPGPCKLTVLDLVGQAETSIAFESNSEYSGSTFAFGADSRTLLVYSPRKPILAMRWDTVKERWSDVRLDVKASDSNCYASCTGEDGAMYVGSGGHIGVLTPGGKAFALLTKVSFAPSKGYPDDGIECMVKVPGRPMLVAGLQDGRLAVVDLTAGTSAARKVVGSRPSQEDQPKP